MAGGLFGLIGGSGTGSALTPVIIPALSSPNKAAKVVAERKLKADKKATERKRIAEEAASAAREAQASAMRLAEGKSRAGAAAKGKCSVSPLHRSYNSRHS